MPPLSWAGRSPAPSRALPLLTRVVKTSLPSATVIGLHLVSSPLSLSVSNSFVSIRAALTCFLEAFCVATARVSNSSALSLSQIKLAATDIFVAQLLNAFGDDTESSYEWLCQNFDYTAINDKLALDSGRVGQAFCANRPYATAWVNPSHDVLVVADSSIYNMASALFATLFSFSASTVTQRWVMCEQYFYMSQAQLQEGINSTIVRSALCLDHDEPLMTLDYSQNLMTDLSTEIFARQLALAVNAVNDEEKQAWLCENIQHGDLGLLGMTANNTLFC